MSQSPLKRQDAMKDLGMTINSSITHPASIPAPAEVKVDANGNKIGGRRSKSNKRKSSKRESSKRKSSKRKSHKSKTYKRKSNRSVKRR